MSRFGAVLASIGHKTWIRITQVLHLPDGRQLPYGAANEELAQFATKWYHPDYRPDRVTADEMDKLEREFDISLPKDYRAQILNTGLPTPTLALMNAIVEDSIDLIDLNELFKPAQAIATTEQWRTAGLPNELLAIGADSVGNLFCFNVNDLKHECAVARVYLWDHDFGATEKISRSFSNWIGEYTGKWSTGYTYKDF
ncbi:SMI1/KNR4 family protein [Roseibium sp.]|uniref:SMI1/KNR4 family protein n=1 Tax=Roseibium sp. TaxID=1936156 RepID=UPI003D152355